MVKAWEALLGLGLVGAGAYVALSLSGAIKKFKWPEIKFPEFGVTPPTEDVISSGWSSLVDLLLGKVEFQQERMERREEAQTGFYESWIDRITRGFQEKIERLEQRYERREEEWKGFLERETESKQEQIKIAGLTPEEFGEQYVRTGEFTRRVMETPKELSRVLELIQRR